MSKTVEVILDVMGGLSNDFHLAPLEEDGGDAWTRITLANETTGLVVEADYRELRVFLTLYRRALFDRPPRGAWDQPVRRGEAFDVDDLLKVRPVDPSPVGRMFKPGDDASLRSLLRDYAVAIS